uniref:Glycosyltransferase n=1 Tax=Linum usitatissimum TaxID=4006 RepID=I2BH62_LINUS|nr:UDP-glycosyltransferase 1 [Linum usitatissimum]
MEPQNGHVFLLPYPGQGHLNPMIHFARRLITRGLRTTLLTTNFSISSSKFGPTIGPVHVETISDGFDEGGFSSSSSIDHYLSRLEQAGSKTLSDLVEKYKTTPYPVSCLVYEPFLPWALDVAKEHGLYAASFFTQPCAVDFIYYNIRHGLLKLPVDTWPVRILGLPELEPRDMPSFVNAPEAYPAYFAMVVNQFSNTEKADYVLINTFYELEKEALHTMSKVCPVLAIGPTVPSTYLDGRIDDDAEYGVDLFSLERSISTAWIATKPPKSVIYVAFGSMVTFNQAQMTELALGFKRTNHYIIWVIQDTELAKLPIDFVSDIGDKALVVNWAPQVQILASGAVGCFFTHSGWNSTIEALSLGVPMVAMPQWTDQPPNAMLVERVWKVGIRVTVGEDGIVSGDEVERCVREVMEGEKGKEMRSNCEKLKGLACLAISEGGSSDKSIDEFVSKLMSYKSH